MSFFPSLREMFLDLVYPPTCVACGEEGEWVCATCSSRMATAPRVREFVSGMRWVSFGSYADPAWRTCIHRLKYGAATCLLPSVEVFLREAREISQVPWPWAGWPVFAVVPMPGDARRMRERGLDHVAAFAEACRRVLFPWAVISRGLMKARQVAPNADLPAGPLRSANVRGAFRWEGAVPQRVVLVDDVATTGATAREAIQTLQSAGVQEICLLTLLRGS
jgi:predicted amidophosphoribosyltransferase